LLAGGYAWFARTSPSHPTGPLEQLTIAATTEYPGSCPIFVAQEKGYFAAERLLVTIHPHSSGKAALDSALEGRADLGTVADVPVMFAVMNGQPVSIVATIFSAEKDHGIIGRRDRGITTPASLKGKRIGVTVGTSGHFVLDAFLNRQKLSNTEVQMLNLRPEELSGALKRGEVDAAVTWQPLLGVLREQLGGNGADFYGEGIYDLVFNLAGKRDYIVGNPEKIKKVLRAVIQGARFCKDAPDMAREILAKAMKTDAAKLKEHWPSYRFEVTLHQSLVLALEDETRWAIKNKLPGAAKMPNYLNYLYLDGLLAVSPAAVSVIH
jgi:NitT/TauT family transport system substrate-binding protein